MATVDQDAQHRMRAISSIPCEKTNIYGQYLTSDPRAIASLFLAPFSPNINVGVEMNSFWVWQAASATLKLGGKGKGVQRRHLKLSFAQWGRRQRIKKLGGNIAA